MSSMRYRSEIDGLRALAVVPVVLFHAGVTGFSGGYVGVDVFFVISGYLITHLIIKDLQNGRFSLLSFYERRARRIFPALIALILVCVPVAWVLMPPPDMKSFSASVVATATFTSNIFFWKESGYFDTAAELKPLLHTWSLAVEEQFYILFPIFMIFTWAKGYWKSTITICILAIASLALSSYAAYVQPSANFYLLPTRAWELLFGSLTAIVLYRYEFNLPLWISNIVSLFGVFLILLAVFTFDGQTPFPGLYAMLPVVGTVLIIAFGNAGTITNRILSLRPLVAIGLVSYSLYLWHQPLFSFYKIYNQSYSISNIEAGVLTGLAFILAALSYFAVEKPFRFGFSAAPRLKVLAVSFGALFAVALVGGTGIVNNGNIWRYNSSQLEFAQTAERAPSAGCADLETLCESEGNGIVVLLGDSNAYHFSDVLNAVSQQNDWTLINATRGGCLPLASFSRRDQQVSFNRRCQMHNRIVANSIERDSSHSERVAIVSAAWALYYYGESYYEPYAHNSARISEISLSMGDIETNIDVMPQEFERYLGAMVSELSVRFDRVVIIGPMPPMAHSFHFGRNLVDGANPTHEDFFLAQTYGLIEIFERLGEIDGVEVFWPHMVLCRSDASPGFCITQHDNKHLYGDETHLSAYGQRFVFEDFFRGLLLQ